MANSLAWADDPPILNVQKHLTPLGLLNRLTCASPRHILGPQNWFRTEFKTVLNLMKYIFSH